MRPFSDTRFCSSLCLILFFLSYCGISEAQTNRSKGGRQPVPVFHGWADSSHFLLSAPGKDSVFLVRGMDGKPESRKKPQTISPRVIVKDGDIFWISPEGIQKKITSSPEEEKNPVLSPDHEKIAFTRENNLFSFDLKTGKEQQHTFDGSSLILNGFSSWIYYEEILGRSSDYAAFWWSPDSRKLTFFRSDDSGVPIFPIYEATGRTLSVRETRYPKAGDPNPKLKIGIVTLENNRLIWADFDQEKDQYFGKPFWSPGSNTLWVQWMNRGQDTLKLYTVDPVHGAKEEIYRESQRTWVDWKDTLLFLKEEAQIILHDDTDGWDQIYAYSVKEKTKTKLTEGRNWHVQILEADPESDWIYYTSLAESSTRRDLYRVRTDGSLRERLTFGPYDHEISLSPGAKYFVTTYSNLSEPPRMAVADIENKHYTDLPGGSTNPDFTTNQQRNTQLIRIKTSDGMELPGLITLPPDVDSSRKYPVLISIYGGPDHGSVSETWPEEDKISYYAKKGWICLTMEHRGSGHLGKTGLNYLHRNLGKWELQDYISWVNYLRSLPYIDINRIGIEGFSYGGYLTSLALTRGSAWFRFGVAGGSVTDWKEYDSHYTERYMDSPEENPEGYQRASVLSYVKSYKNSNRLRIEHGTSDDNVHLRHSLLLIEALQKAGKSFEMMLYPGAKHGWSGERKAHSDREEELFLDRYLWNTLPDKRN